MARPPQPPAAPESRAIPIAIAAVAIVTFVVFVAGNIATTGPSNDETVHLVAGYTYLATGDYRLNPEHPPLLKKLAALPLLSMSVWPAKLMAPGDGTASYPMLREAWAMSFTKPIAHWVFAHHLLFSLRDDALRRVAADPLHVPTTVKYERRDFLNDTGAMFRRARIAMMLPGVLLALVIFVWSRELWGWWAAAFSVLLFCCDPNFIAHTGLVTTDVGVSLLMTTALYFFWRTSRKFTWLDATAFAIAFALAQVAKFSAVLMIPMLLILAVHRRKQLAQTAIVIALAAVTTVLAIWATYGFRFTAAVDPALAVQEETEVRKHLIDSQFETTDREPTGHPWILSTLQETAATKIVAQQFPNIAPPFSAVRPLMRDVKLPLSAKIILFFNRYHLLPEGYLNGIASVQLSSISRNVYLRGDYGVHGFASYFFWTTLYKVPIPILVALAIGVVLAFRGRTSALPYLAWPIVIYLMVAVVSAVNIGHRHILPIFPLLYIACGAIAPVWRRWPRKRLIATVAIAIVLLIVPLVVVLTIPLAPMWGHHLSYMNELAGGPIYGYQRLVDSNLDWGQDLPELAQWLDEHRVTEPVYLLYFGTADPKYYGIRHTNGLLGYFAEEEHPFDPAKPPKYIAISANTYNGFLFAPDSRFVWSQYLNEHAREVGRAGYSIYIFETTR